MKRTLEQRETLRAQHRPEILKLLLIGESPPTSGDFFYDADSLLFHATVDAFQLAFPDECLRGARFLECFEKSGCYLEDLCQDPIDKLPGRERQAAREAGINPLAERLEVLRPREIVIIFKEARKDIITAVTRSRIFERPDLHLNAVPFPLWYRSDYVEQLSGLLRRVLAPARKDPAAS